MVHDEYETLQQVFEMGNTYRESQEYFKSFDWPPYMDKKICNSNRLTVQLLQSVCSFSARISRNGVFEMYLKRYNAAGRRF